MRTVPIAAVMFMNFCALTLFLSSFSIALNIVSPTIAPKVFVIISVISRILTSSLGSYLIRLIDKRTLTLYLLAHSLIKSILISLIDSSISIRLESSLGKERVNDFNLIV